MSSQQDLERDISDYKQYEEQLSILEQQIAIVDETISNTQFAIDALKVLSEAEGEKEILVPLGPGINLPVTVRGGEKLIVNVGADVSVEMTPGETIELLEQKTDELRATREKLASTFKEVNNRMANLGEKIEKEYTESLLQKR